MQLNHERVNPSTITFSNRYIYVIGGTLDTDCLEVIDTYKENVNRKAELFLLIKGSFSPWFNDMLIPLDEEGLLLFCGERYNQPAAQREEQKQHQPVKKSKLGTLISSDKSSENPLSNGGLKKDSHHDDNSYY